MIQAFSAGTGEITVVYEAADAQFGLGDIRKTEGLRKKEAKPAPFALDRIAIPIISTRKESSFKIAAMCVLTTAMAH